MSLKFCIDKLVELNFVRGAWTSCWERVWSIEIYSLSTQWPTLRPKKTSTRSSSSRYIIPLAIPVRSVSWTLATFRSIIQSSPVCPAPCWLRTRSAFLGQIDHMKMCNNPGNLETLHITCYSIDTQLASGLAHFEHSRRLPSLIRNFPSHFEARKRTLIQFYFHRPRAWGSRGFFASSS